MGGKLAVVTGASSVVMNSLIDKLINGGFRIIAITRKIQKKEVRKNVVWVECNLANELCDFSFLKNADILFHAASISNFYNHHDYLRNNYQSTINLVDASLKNGVKKFVYISSLLAGYEFGEYGLSKIKSEDYIKENIENWLIIRPSQLYGYSLSNPIDKLIDNIRKRRIVLCPTGDRKGIYPLYYKDLTNFIFDTVIENGESIKVEVITGPKAYNYRSLIDEIVKQQNKKLMVIPIPKIFIILVYHFIMAFSIKIGIYTDQLYRFYNNPSVEISSHNTLSITDYLKDTSNFDTLL